MFVQEIIWTEKGRYEANEMKRKETGQEKIKYKHNIIGALWRYLLHRSELEYCS